MEESNRTRFPISKTILDLLTMDEREKNLSPWKEILPSLVYFFLKNFVSIRDFSISKPKEGKKVATKLIFVEFERPEDAASLFDHCGLNE
jgi:hypothetical protein